MIAAISLLSMVVLLILMSVIISPGADHFLVGKPA